MHDLYAIFAKYLEICKHFGKRLINDKGNNLNALTGLTRRIGNRLLYLFTKARKRIETVFSQMCDQFMIGRNNRIVYPNYLED